MVSEPETRGFPSVSSSFHQRVTTGLIVDQRIQRNLDDVLHLPGVGSESNRTVRQSHDRLYQEITGNHVKRRKCSDHPDIFRMNSDLLMGLP